MPGLQGDAGHAVRTTPKPTQRRAWQRVCAAAIRHTPAALAGGVTLLLLGQMALLVASWLPWKMLALLGAGTPLPGWPSSWPSGQTALVLALATLAAYAAYLACDAALSRLARRGATRLRESTGKTGLFNQQDRLSQLIYTQMLRSAGAACFALLGGAVLAWQLPALAWLAVGWTAAGACWWARVPLPDATTGAAPSRRPQWALQGFVVGGFLLACGLLIGTRAATDAPHLFALLLLLMLYRQVLAQVAALALHTRALQRRQSEALALFVASAPWRAPLPAPCAFAGLWHTGNDHTVLGTVFERRLGRPPGALHAHLKKTHRGQIAEWTLQDASAPEHGLFVRVFNHTRDTLARQESDLLTHEPGLPGHTWLGIERWGGLACHHLAWSAAWSPVPDTQRRVANRAMRTQLLGHAPSPETLARYRRSRATLADRLPPGVLAALRQDILTPEASQALEALLPHWPTVRARLDTSPLRLVLPQLGTRALLRDTAGQLLLMDWTRWRLEPAGAGWPVSPQLRNELQAALTERADPALNLDLLELAARVYELDQRLELHDSTGAHALLPGIAQHVQSMLHGGHGQTSAT